MEDSFNAMLELPNFRFDANHQDIFDIVDNLVEKAVPKKNCLDVVSNPSEGKNIFFDAPSHFKNINRGTIRNRFSNSPLQNTVGRCILIRNECNCKPSAFDTVNKIFGARCGLCCSKILT